MSYLPARMLEGAELDAAVAKIKGLPCRVEDGECLVIPLPLDPIIGPDFYHYCPSINWCYGGPILEENPWLLPQRSLGHVAHLGAFTSWTPAGFEHFGPTPLIAAMRAFVASFGPPT